jgi:aspartate carbamoyltransferase catalytic subunit
MRIKELKKEIEEQKEKNIELFKSIPLPSHADPCNKKAETILTEWRKGSKKLKGMLKELAELEKAEKSSTNEVKTNEKTFVNGFGEATKRKITCSTYERAEKRLSKEILSFMGSK